MPDVPLSELKNATDSPHDAPLAVVLVVDDTQSFRRQVTDLVMRHCWARIIEAHNGAQALALLHQHTVDAVVTDINMPVLDGLKLVKAIRQMADYQTKPVVVMSTLSGEADRHRAMALGATAYVTKPIDEKELLAHLQLPPREKVLAASAFDEGHVAP